MRRTLSRLAVTAAIAAGSLTGIAALGGSSAGGADPSSVLYNSSVSPLPGNLVSQAFEATQTAEFGDAVHLANSAEPLNNVVLTMSSWTCGNWASGSTPCTTSPGTSYNQPLTFNFYTLNADGSVGPRLATDTQTFAIPFRPSASAACAATPINKPGDWMNATGSCFAGLATNVTFGFSAQNVTLPSNVIYSIAYNTGSFGAHPLGEPTPDDSLNVALTSDPTNVTTGFSEFPGKLYMNTQTAGDYCDNGVAGVGTFRLDSPGTDATNCPNPNGGWSINGGGAPFYVPAVQINADVAPTVTNLTPTSGPTIGGTSALITGSNLGNVVSVKFGSASATLVNDNGTQIQLVTPAGTGTVPVTVTIFGGSTSAGTFTYVPAPAVTSVSPNTGPLGGGNSVTVSGSNLAGATAVDFNGTAGTITAEPASGTSVTVKAPAGVFSVNVSVVTAGGTSATSSNDTYTYVAAPIVSGVTPTSGPAAGGTTVAIAGSSFSNASAVSFGGTAAESFTVNSATSITAKSPAGVGTVDVSVTAPGGTSAATTGDTFTYVPAATTLTTAPALLLVGLTGLSVLQGPNATLTSGGHAVAGQTITFKTVTGASLCTAVTNSAGTATCGALAVLPALLGLGYVATYAGNGSTGPSSTTGLFLQVVL